MQYTVGYAYVSATDQNLQGLRIKIGRVPLLPLVPFDNSFSRQVFESTVPSPAKNEERFF